MNTILTIMGYICLVMFVLYGLKLIVATFLKPVDGGEKWLHLLMVTAAIGDNYLLKYVQSDIENRAKWLVLSFILFAFIIGITILLIRAEHHIRKEDNEISDSTEE